MGERLFPPPPAWRAALDGLPAPAWRYYPRVGSTNDAAWAWAATGAAEGCFVVADAQTAGRGRSGRRWYTPPQRALAVSVVVRPLPGEAAHLPRYAAWAALAMAEALAQWDVPVALKWPNDLLLHDRKIGGALAETRWQGDTPWAAVLGVGVNLLRGSTPPSHAVDYPAGDVESLTGRALPRPQVTAAFWRRWAWWRPRLGSPAFVAAWQQRLAWRGQQVRVHTPQGETVEGVLHGLDPEGGLRLLTAAGPRVIRHAGTVRRAPTGPSQEE